MLVSLTSLACVLTIASYQEGAFEATKGEWPLAQVFYRWLCAPPFAHVCGAYPAVAAYPL